MSRSFFLSLAFLPMLAMATTVGDVSAMGFLFGVASMYLIAATLTGVASAFVSYIAQLLLFVAGFVLAFTISPIRAVWWTEHGSMFFGVILVAFAWHTAVLWIVGRMRTKPSQSNQPLHPDALTRAGERRR